jgi:hypothetical protein
MRTFSLDAFPQQTQKPLEDFPSSVRCDACFPRNEDEGLQPYSPDPRHLRQKIVGEFAEYKRKFVRRFFCRRFLYL